MKYNLKLNIKSIVAYEQLTKQSFQSFNGATEQIIPLLYAIIVSNNEYKETYEDTLKYLFADTKTLKQLSKELEKELKFEEQFRNNISNTDEDSNTDSNTEQQLYISQMIPILIDCGLSIEYILNEMRYTEIDTYIRYKNEKEKTRLTEKRLFTYLTILPHIDSKKCSSPQQLLPFEWEKEEKKQKGLKEIKDNKHKLEEFMKSGTIDFKPE